MRRQGNNLEQFGLKVLSAQVIEEESKAYNDVVSRKSEHQLSLAKNIEGT